MASIRATDAIVDVLVVYTESLESYYGDPDGVEALVRSAFFSANQAFASSETEVKLRLAGVRKVAYTESYDDMEVDLDHLVNTDGVMDEVHAWRNEVGADLVCLFRVDAWDVDSAGIAWLLSSIKGESHRGFSVVTGEYALSDLVLQHEIGHNLGAAHDRETSKGGGLYAYSHGYRFFGDDISQYRTVMAYNPGRRINYFSNPKKQYKGRPMGVADGAKAADNARTFRSSGDVVAAYRKYVNSPPIADAGEDLLVEDDDGDGRVIVRLDGSGSFDWAGIVSWTWTWQGGSASGEVVNATFPVGQHVVTLSIRDEEGLTASDTLKVEVAEFGEVVGVYSRGNATFYLKENGFVFRPKGDHQSGFERLEIRDVADVSAGYNHYLFLRADGSVYGSGENADGQLGLAGIGRVSGAPVEIFKGGIKSIAAGRSFSLFVRNDGTVWACGRGSLGLGEVYSANPPQQMEVSGRKVAAGDNFGLLLKEDGSLWAVGSLSAFATDTGEPRLGSYFARIFAGGVADMAAGYQHAVVLMQDGSVWTLGKDGRGGALGAGKNPSEREMHKILDKGGARVGASTRCTYVILSDGSLWGTGEQLLIGPDGQKSSSVLVKLLGGRARAIAGGDAHALILRTDGSVWGTGSNAAWQLGLESRDFFTDLVAIRPGARSNGNMGPVARAYAGYGQTIIDDDNDGFARMVLDGAFATDDWQITDYRWSVDGASFVGKRVEIEVPVGSVSVTLVVVDDEGVSDSHTIEVAVRPFTKAVSAFSGSEGLYVVRADGSLWGLANSRRVLGLPPEELDDRWHLLFPADVIAAAGGTAHTLALKKDGSLWGIGSNESGQLGQPGGDYFGQPVLIVPGGVVEIAAAEYHSIFRLEDGSVWGLGASAHFALGLGGDEPSIEPRLLSRGPVAQIATSESHSFFRLDDGSIVGGLRDDGTRFTFVVKGAARMLAADSQKLIYADSQGRVWGRSQSFEDIPVGTRILDNRPRRLEMLGDGVESAYVRGASLIAVGGGRAAGIGTNKFRGSQDYALSEVDVLVAAGAKQVAGAGNRLIFILEDGSVWGLTHSDSSLRTERSVFNGGEEGKLMELGKGDGTWVNRAPVARGKVRSLYRKFHQGATAWLSLEGGKSTDDRFIAKWLWTIEGVEYQGRNARIAAAPGETVVQLTVVDSDGESASESYLVTVSTDPVVGKLYAGKLGTFYVRKNGQVQATMLSNNYEWFGKSNNGGGAWAAAPLELPHMQTLEVGGQNLAGIANDGTLWAGGANQHGQLGYGYRSLFVPLAPLGFRGEIHDLAVGDDCLLVVKKDGSLWGCGSNLRGRLGLPLDIGYVEEWQQILAEGVAKVASFADTTFVVKEDGSVWLCGADWLSREEWTVGPEWRMKLEGGAADVVAAQQSCFVLMQDGSVRVAGYEYEGSLGTGSEANGPLTEGFAYVMEGGVSKVVSSGKQTLFLKEDGSVWGTGHWINDALANARQPVYRPVRVMGQSAIDVAIGENVGLVLREDGAVFAVGSVQMASLHSEWDVRYVETWEKMIAGDGTWPMRPPVADAGTRIEHFVEEGDSAQVQLSGEGSYDDWHVAEHIWHVDGNRFGGRRFEYQFPLGITPVVLEVIDTDGNRSTDTSYVFVDSRDAYESWLAECFSPDALARMEDLKEADPDGDGLPNRMERRLNLDPSDPRSSVGVTAVVYGDSAHARLLGVEAERPPRVLGSNDLSTWRKIDAPFEWIDSREAVTTLPTSSPSFLKVEY